MIRKALLVFAPVAASAAWLACSETGPDAPPRGNEGPCVGAICEVSYEGGSPGADGSGPITDGGGGWDGNTADPLQGTSGVATLVKGGFQFTEGPVWIGGRLLFSDVQGNTIHELLGDGGTTPFRTNSGGANGLAIDPNGNLVACEGGNKRVTRSQATSGAGRTTIAGQFADAGFNAPNDVVVRSDGNVYFTDPCYGCTVTQNDESVYRIAPGGGISRLGQNFNRPNGIALSPDGNKLYVVDNGAGKLQEATVNANGTVGGFQELVDLQGAPNGDGTAVDDAGNLYVATKTGVRVFLPAGGEIGTVNLAEEPANCTFGGADRRTLFITARTGLYAITLNVPGLP